MTFRVQLGETRQRPFVFHSLKLSLGLKYDVQIFKIYEQVVLHLPMPLIFQDATDIYDNTPRQIYNVAFYKCLFRCIMQMSFFYTSSSLFQCVHILRCLSQIYKICIQTYLISLLHRGPSCGCTYNLFIHKCSFFLQYAPGFLLK